MQATKMNFFPKNFTQITHSCCPQRLEQALNIVKCTSNTMIKAVIILKVGFKNDLTICFVILQHNVANALKATFRLYNHAPSSIQL